ncbi:MAG: outer membrane beta-barrel domain-containing protein [Bdellovibrionaceae bacterium]|nr:outer membrane beta-barrel domain-containing protein [Pseudobdellovibrionaceae bacterium]
MKNGLNIWIMSFTLGLLSPAATWAQDGAASDNEELKIIEVELENDATRSQNTAPADSPATGTGETTAGSLSEEAAETQTQAPEPRKDMEFKDLGHLAPFSEVSVIQRRFMPKTGRFQLFGGLTMITNDPFFNVFGGVGKAGYFFTETLGVELNYFALSTGEAKATQELKSMQGVQTDNLIITKNFWSADVVYAPIYGKMSWFDKTIIPFDLYFSLGYGATGTQNGSAGTLHLAAGQIFSMSKSTAFRWDFSWNFFDAKGIDGKTSSYNNLFLTLGWSWFFPEAKYR